MKKLRILALLSALTLTVSALAGCTAKDTKAPSTPSTPASKTEGEATTPTPATDGPSWKRDTSPVTLEWFFAYDWYGKKFNPDTNLADKKLLEETGVTLKILTGDVEKFNTLIATKSLPAIVTTDMVATQRKLLENNKQLLPLDDLMKEHAPDLNVPQSMVDWYTNPDGHWYAFASFYYGPERTNPDFGGSYVTHNNNFVRTDILKQIGMTMDDMKTKDGFMKALKAVKEKGIKYGGKAVTPFVGTDAVFFAQQFGADMESKDGKLVNIMRTPEYLEALQYFNEMYKNGLFTDEEFTMNIQQKETKVSSGDAFAACGWMTVQNPRKALFSVDPEALLMYCGQINGGDSGKTPILSSVNAGGWTGTMITKEAKKPDRAVQLFSYLSQEEMALENEYGTGTYEIKDGKVLRDATIAKEFEANYQAAVAKYKLDISFFQDWTIIQKYYPEPVSVYEKDQYQMERDKDIVIYDDKCFADVKPDGGTELASVQERVDAYWTQAIPNVIMAKNAEECKKLLESSLVEMDKLGLDKLDEYKDQRFQENKTRLGVKFAWPRNQ